MTVREILTVGHPVLRHRAEEIDPADLATAELQELIADLIDTMRHANGAGIAANQIGVARRVAVIEVNDNPRYPYKPTIPLTVVVNPVIEPIDDELVEINEGCLSVPNLRGSVDRYVNVRVRSLDEHGNARDEIKRGLTAGTYQHECDHLDGRLFLDRVSDPTTFTTWEQFERYHRDAFVERITRVVARVGS
ncbi:MAG TPA: peptide deformylase [Desertimonas sp.]|nr:peptide deformylase [Desertimonas sp.]